MLLKNQHCQQNAVHRFQIVAQVHRKCGNHAQSPDLEPVKPHRADKRKNQQFSRFRQSRQKPFRQKASQDAYGDLWLLEVRASRTRRLFLLHRIVLLAGLR